MALQRCFASCSPPVDLQMDMDKEYGATFSFSNEIVAFPGGVRGTQTEGGFFISSNSLLLVVHPMAARWLDKRK